MALLDSITNAPRNQRIALGAIGCVVVGALGYFLLLCPKQTARDAMPGLYRQISDLAFQSGLAMDVFTPRAPEEKEIFFDVPITVSAEGTYHQFGGFLARMGKMPRIV